MEINSNDKLIFYIYLTEKDFDKVTFSKKNFIKRKANYLWHSLSEQIGFCSLLYKDDLDLMHFTYFSYPVLYWKKFITTVHDVTPLLFKTGKASTKNQFIYQIKHLFFRIILDCQIKRAVKIIAPTNTVKELLINIYGSKISQKVQSIYEGINYQLVNIKKENNLNNKFNNFFIYVGNFYPHKNVEKLIEAFSKINRDFKLVLIGPNDYFQLRIVQLINQLYMKDKVIFYTNPSYADLVFFYKNAKAIIHPSLSEGFGLPLIEAVYFDCPIIASDIKVFKELLGNNYLSFNPNDVDDIAEKINTFIDKKPTFEYSQIMKKYSFEKMTKETLKIYSETR